MADAQRDLTDGQGHITDRQGNITDGQYDITVSALDDLVVRVQVQVHNAEGQQAVDPGTGRGAMRKALVGALRHGGEALAWLVEEFGKKVVAGRAEHWLTSRIARFLE